MQDIQATRRLDAPPVPGEAGSFRGAIFPKVRTAFWHGLGAIALAIAMMAQPVGAAGEVSANTPGPSSQTPLTSSALPATGAPTQSQFFSPTGMSVQGEFLGAFQKFGLSRIGYPISGEQQDNGITVQYFERVRMELHPELASKGYGVLFTRLGAQMTRDAQFARVAPFATTSSDAYFSQTGHSLAEPFLSYWKANGAIQLFGYPISEPLTQDGLTVQWFERARMEYHPELAGAGQVVQLTLLGDRAYGQTNGTQKVQSDSIPSQSQAAAAQSPSADKESYLLKAINDQRAAAGLAPVQLSSSLTDLARSRSSDMAVRNYFSHTTPEGTNFLSMLGSRGIPYKFAGEILARNNYPDNQAAATAMSSYLNSTPHKAIIMDPRYTLVGVGYAKSSSDTMHYFTVIFVQQ
jgi:uncharacterized protein YkwD